MELFWEVDYAATPEGEGTALHNRPQRRPRPACRCAGSTI